MASSFKKSYFVITNNRTKAEVIYEITYRKYYNYDKNVYKYREFLDGLVQCGFDVIFLDKLNNYIFERWRNFYDQYLLAAFAGTLYNMFHLWSVRDYKEKKVLVEAVIKLYENNDVQKPLNHL